MARYFARIVRAVIVSSLGFGGGVGLFAFIFMLVYTGKQNSLVFALQMSIVMGLAFGLFCAVIMLLIDLTTRLFAAHGVVYDEIWELEQTRELQVEGTIKDARAISRRALQTVPNIKAVADEDEYQIRGSVGPSLKSPGERIQVVISPAGDNKWTVRCVSSCLSDKIAFDYGKNFENVETWVRAMRSMAPEGQIGGPVG